MKNESVKASTVDIIILKTNIFYRILQTLSPVWRMKVWKTFGMVLSRNRDNKYWYDFHWLGAVFTQNLSIFVHTFCLFYSFFCFTNEIMFWNINWKAFICLFLCICMFSTSAFNFWKKEKRPGRLVSVPGFVSGLEEDFKLSGKTLLTPLFLAIIFWSLYFTTTEGFSCKEKYSKNSFSMKQIQNVIL